MRDFFDAQRGDEILSRIEALRPDAVRQWGKMTAGQMLAHCSIAVEAAHGERPMKQAFLGKLLTPGEFGPDALLEGMVPAIADPSANIEALHVFTFNQVAATVEWQRRMLASLDRA